MSSPSSAPWVWVSWNTVTVTSPRPGRACGASAGGRGAVVTLTGAPPPAPWLGSDRVGAACPVQPASTAAIPSTSRIRDLGTVCRIVRPSRPPSGSALPLTTPVLPRRFPLRTLPLVATPSRRLGRSGRPHRNRRMMAAEQPELDRALDLYRQAYEPLRDEPTLEVLHQQTSPSAPPRRWAGEETRSAAQGCAGLVTAGDGRCLPRPRPERGRGAYRFCPPRAGTHARTVGSACGWPRSTHARRRSRVAAAGHGKGLPASTARTTRSRACRVAGRTAGSRR